MHKSIEVSMCACIIYVCMHVHMFGSKNPYACRPTCMILYMYVSKYVYRETCMLMLLCVHEYIYVHACMYVGRHA